jgi:hypothetical protein
MELAFEYLLAGIEAARGTLLVNPTRYLNLAGTVSPKIERYRPSESRGTLAEYYRSVAVKKWSEWEAEGGLDVYTLPTILNCISNGGITVPEHPIGGVVGILDLEANVATLETVTIGTDVYEVDVIATDSTADTAAVDFDNVTDPLTIDLAAAGYAAFRALVVNHDLLRINNEIMYISALAGTTFTFQRGWSGTTIAVHAVGQDMYVSNHAGAPGTDTYVGFNATFTPAVAGPAFEDVINSAILARDYTAYWSAGLLQLEITSDAQHALMTTAETLAGALNAWQAATIRNLIWDFAPNMTADDLNSMSIYWGDPNIQALVATYCMLNDMTMSGDASGTDGVTLSVSGQGRFMAKTPPGVVPSMIQAPLLMPSAMQLWIDTVTIGTTAVTGRVVSAEFTVPSGITYKWLAAGVAGDLQFQMIGRGKRHAEMKLVFEVPDMVQYDLWVTGTTLKVKLRFNGAQINTSGVGLTPAYYYVDCDIYGPFDALAWGENESTNRTIELTVLSEYDTTFAADWAIHVQSNMATL